jgi:hypothetical protein
MAYGVRRPLRHRQVRSRVASAVRIAGSTQGIRFLDTPLDDLFECSWWRVSRKEATDTRAVIEINSIPALSALQLRS